MKLRSALDLAATFTTLGPSLVEQFIVSDVLLNQVPCRFVKKRNCYLRFISFVLIMNFVTIFSEKNRIQAK